MRALLVLVAMGAGAEAETRRTGYDDMSAELQAMQDDTFANPGMFWVLDGERLWSEPAGEAGRACADCHAAVDMAGVAARYPAFDSEGGRAVDLPGRINLCRTRHQQAPALSRESDPLLALTAFVARQSDGRPISPDPAPELDAARARGEALFTRRMGQLNLSCSQCHADNAGGRLAAALIPEAHPTGYPQYRLEWESMGSLHRRFANCMTGIRAEPFAPGSDAFIALELYLKERAAGLPVEAPAIRP